MIPNWEDVPFPIFELDEELNVLKNNEALLVFLGIPFESSSSICLSDYIYSDDGVKGNCLTNTLSYIEGKKNNVLIKTKEGNVLVTLSLFESNGSYYGIFFDLTSQLQENEKFISLREKMVKGMYQQGIAQSAIGVLHNIGNLLTVIKTNADNEQVLSELSIISSVFKKVEASIKGDFDREVISKLLKTINHSYPAKITQISKSFETILEMVASMDEVIKTQQKYALVDNDKIEVFNILDLVKDSLSLNNDRIRKRDIVVSINMDNSLEGKFEKSGLTQIFSNIIINAIESMDTRFDTDPNYIQKTIEIAASVDSEILLLKIIDNGSGFDPSINNKLFEFGFSTKKRGSGFGLHECRSMLKFYGGSMDIRSEGPNKGATTEVRIPKA